MVERWQGYRGFEGTTKVSGISPGIAETGIVAMVRAYGVLYKYLGISRKKPCTD
jgi:hypothetical protein